MLQRLDFAWRLLATGFCFACFGLGGLVIGVTLFPVAAMLPGTVEQRRQRVQHLVRAACRLFLRTVQLLGVGRVTVTNATALAGNGRRLVLANHPTLLDVVVLIALLPQADCVVKQALWRNPFLRSVVRGAGYVSNSSPEALLRECGVLLRDERSLLLFPEGTRSQPGQPLAFQRGAARIALQTGTPILPVTLTCEPPTLMKDSPWYRIPSRRWHIRVMAHGPVSTECLLDRRDIPEPAAVRRLTASLQALFERKLEEHELAYQRIA